MCMLQNQFNNMYHKNEYDYSILVYLCLLSRCSTERLLSTDSAVINDYDYHGPPSQVFKVLSFPSLNCEPFVFSRKMLNKINLSIVHKFVPFPCFRSPFFMNKGLFQKTTQLSDFFRQQIWTLFWFVPDCFPVLKTKYKTQLWIWIQVCDRNTKCRRRLGVERWFWSHFSHERLHKYQQSFRIFCARSDLIFYLLSKYNTLQFKSCKWMDGRTESNIRIHFLNEFLGYSETILKYLEILSIWL